MASLVSSVRFYSDSYEYNVANRHLISDNIRWTSVERTVLCLTLQCVVTYSFYRVTTFLEFLEKPGNFSEFCKGQGKLAIGTQLVKGEGI